ncbi:hypothetical protein GTY65_38945 [Streptomyces sp. SID8379]|uniref:hypothetical protein n=1 Tax=unclassified Streptomyces TaxID=2593676 RepID=UPI000369775E|nr:MULTISPECIES: hypothetical protein [unclassified Streptomyces]MYW69989.1 hypothetical protein [Streptomyces sp. SID8379]
MSFMSAGVTWLGLGLTLNMAGLVTYGLAALPCSATVRAEDAELVCRPARRTALGLGALGATAVVVGTVFLVLHVVDFG